MAETIPYLEATELAKCQDNFLFTGKQNWLEVFSWECWLNERNVLASKSNENGPLVKRISE